MKYGHFLIVTPTHNSERYLDEAISSVVQQTGAFRIRYHVQDGGSTDSTLEKLTAWQRRIQNGWLPIFCQGIEFSFDSTPDQGMYDAINRGFKAILSDEPAVMSWINSDDRYCLGAFSTSIEVFASCSAECFIGGRSALCGPSGDLTVLWQPLVYPRRTLVAGLHDNRHLSVIMQEGTFWLKSLWDAVGGLQADLRLAGDFDLWRRFAQLADFISVDNVLAVHRRHSDQLTNNLDNYYREVDKILGANGCAMRDAEWARYQKASRFQGSALAQGYVGKMTRYHLFRHLWVVVDEVLWSGRTVWWYELARWVWGKLKRLSA